MRTTLARDARLAQRCTFCQARKHQLCVGGECRCDAVSCEARRRAGAGQAAARDPRGVAPAPLPADAPSPPRARPAPSPPRPSPPTATADGLVWEDPPEAPARGRRGRDWDGLCAPLREHPGRWARVAIFQSKGAAYSAGQAIRKGKTPLDPERHEVLAVRGKPTDHWESALYVRYLDPEGGS